MTHEEEVNVLKSIAKSLKQIERNTDPKKQSKTKETEREGVHKLRE